ncbi:toprim domain-containing protein [Thioalkalivibrio sp. ALMg11]|uniref:toprim domain-containing protein n=1 Tax=Thioalkalivibrio sp. ALMg11 TaxID=1158165 RepID=UPI0003704717|nr:toprim domain-containing protein [Thioalkalivibrio sp. ALMg11]
MNEEAKNDSPRWIDTIKKQVDLEAFLTDQGFRFTRGNSGLRSDSCPSCGHKAHSNRLGIRAGRYHCFSCGAKGSVVDAAMAIYGASISDTIKRLMREYWVHESLGPRVQDNPPPAPQESSETLKRVVAAVFQASLKDSSDHIRYLRDSRGISERVIREAIERGLLRFLPGNPFRARDFMAEAAGGVDQLVEAGLMKPGKKMPAGAYRPLLWFFPGLDSIEFRLARSANEGERKALRYGIAAQPSIWEQEGSKSLAVVEGVIDVLSMVDLGYTGDVMGLPGTNAWRPEWFQNRVNKQTTICFDGDSGGRHGAERLKEILDEEHGIAVDIRCPSSGDINDQLRRRRTAAA